MIVFSLRNNLSFPSIYLFLFRKKRDKHTSIHTHAFKYTAFVIRISRCLNEICQYRNIYIYTTMLMIIIIFILFKREEKKIQRQRMTQQNEKQINSKSIHSTMYIYFYLYKIIIIIRIIPFFLSFITIAIIIICTHTI